MGETTLIQVQFPEDHCFHKMPVQLNGLIADLAEGGPYPVVLILHGAHPGCPVDEAGVDRSGATACVAVCADEPALHYPADEIQPDGVFGETFTGRLPLTPVRVSSAPSRASTWPTSPRWRSSSTRPRAARFSSPTWSWCARRFRRPLR